MRTLYVVAAVVVSAAVAAPVPSGNQLAASVHFFGDPFSALCQTSLCQLQRACAPPQVDFYEPERFAVTYQCSLADETACQAFDPSALADSGGFTVKGYSATARTRMPQLEADGLAPLNLTAVNVRMVLDDAPIDAACCRVRIGLPTTIPPKKRDVFPLDGEPNHRRVETIKIREGTSNVVAVDQVAFQLYTGPCTVDLVVRRMDDTDEVDIEFDFFTGDT